MAAAYNELDIDELDEISAVDNPAQPGARAVIFKRDFSAEEREHLADEGDALPDGSFPIRNLQDLQNAIDAIGRAKDRGRAIAHIKRRAVALGASDRIPESFGKNTPGIPEGTQEPGTMTDTKKTADEQLVDVQKQLTQLQAELAVANALAGLSDAEKAIHKGLDKDGQTAFLKLSQPERASRVSAAAESNPVAYTSLSGEVFRKNDDPRLIAMAKRADQQEKDLGAERAVRKLEALQKRAETELSHFPKETIVKAALLGAVESIADEATRTSVREMLKAGDSALAKHFVARGTAADTDEPGDADEAHEKLEKIAKGLREKEPKLNEFDAYVKACEQNPELHEQAVGSTVGEER